MAKPFRSPLVGYNHNLSHLGRVFHVQTEDSGPSTPRLFTHLFFEGTILASRKHEYEASLPDDQVRVLMREQHKLVMRDLMQARFDERIIAFFAARGQDLSPGASRAAVQGAVPSAPLTATPGPVVVAPPNSGAGAIDPPPPVVSMPGVTAAASGSGDVAADAIPADDVEDGSIGGAAAGVAAAAAAAAEAGRRADAPGGGRPQSGTGQRPAGGAPAPVGYRRRVTRPMQAFNKGAQQQLPIVIRSSQGNRVIVRNEPAAAAKTASADGVVVERNVVVGGKAAAPRIRPAVPYVVTGGGHTERPPQPAVDAASAQAVPGPAPAGGAESTRPTTGFGVGRTDDKSLDEVILEYLGEDDP